MKKLACLLLCLALLPEGAVSLAEASYPPVFFTASCRDASETLQYDADGLYEYLRGKFNFTYELYPITTANANEKGRIWINGGTMPDTIWLNEVNYNEYLDSIGQGLVAPLPDGWEETYPALYNMIMATGVADKFTVDGRIYCVPHATLYNFSPVDTPVTHQSIYYRADWAEALGLAPFGLTIAEEELYNFLRLAVAHDLAGNGKTVGLTAYSNSIFEPLMHPYNAAYSRFVKVDGRYVWGPTVEGTIEGIKKARKWYQDGLIDPDFYLLTHAESRNLFSSGLAAAMVDSGGVTNVQDRAAAVLDAGAPFDPYEDMKLAVLVDENGKWHGPVSGNYWSVHMFRPDIAPDVFHAILSIMNELCTEQGEITVCLGLEGTDWERGADGDLAVLRAPREDGTYAPLKETYPSWQFYYLMGVLPDDFSFVNPAYDDRIIENVVALYKEKTENGVLTPQDNDYNFFSSESKAEYSVDVVAEIIRLMLAGDEVDVDAAWNEFIESNRAIWEPVVNDLNAAFAR